MHQNHLVDNDDSKRPEKHERTDKTSDKLAKDSPEATAKAYRAALKANPDKTNTVSPNAKPGEGFSLTHKGNVIASKETTDAASDKHLGNVAKPHAPQEKSEEPHQKTAEVAKSEPENIDRIKEAASKALRTVSSGMLYEGGSPLKGLRDKTGSEPLAEKTSYVPAGTPLEIRGHGYPLNELTAQGLDSVSDVLPPVRDERDRPMIAQVHRENPEESFSESLKRLHPNEKLVPKDGDPPLTLKQLLNDYKTPFIDAYEQSKHLKDGAPGKSKTLEDIVDRMKACPWADQIRIKFDKNAVNPEYDPVKNTITIRPQDKPDAQIQLFSHEAYHSTHQFLNTMYSGANVLDKQTFTNTLLGGEVGSMVAEAKVHQELKLGTEQPQFFFKNVQGVEDHIDIGPYVKEHGSRGLFDFLEKAEPVRKGQEPYGIYYQKNYQPYADHFAANKPAAIKIIQQWVKAGHKAEDI